MMGFFARFFARAKPALSEASARDAGAIGGLHAASFRHGWSEQEVEALLIDRAVIAHRVTFRGRLLGFIISRMAADEAEILSVAVAARAQGRGFARALLNLHLGRLAGLSVRAVFLEVDENNTPAIRLYDRAGFREVARRPNYYTGDNGKPSTALVLRRGLS
jgi:ribosomal-protein-alanine N-acetyltransferase